MFSGRDVSCGVAARCRIAAVALRHVHQDLEGGHLLPQRGGDPGDDGAISDSLGVDMAKENIK